LLPKRLLDLGTSGADFAPRYLDESDGPWLRALLDAYAAFEGRRRRELDDRLREPLSPDAPRKALARARHVLDRLCGERTKAPRPPREVRATLFGEAARRDREEALRHAAEHLGLNEEAMMDALFADVPGERRLVRPERDVDPEQLRLRTNLALVQGLLAHASEVRVEALGNARDLVRHARLRGLLCVARPVAGAEDRLVLEISGPLALFRRTRVYGRALAGIVPRLPWCADFDARARIEVGETTGILRIRPGDPIFPAAEPRRFDSKLEVRFAKDFAAAAPDWDVIREPRPVPVEDTLVFPDFQLRHRRHADRVWWVEIIGFWTPAYLETKLRRLSKAGLSNLILCVDAAKAAGRTDLPTGARVVAFERRVDVSAVLAIVDRIGAA